MVESFVVEYPPLQGKTRDMVAPEVTTKVASEKAAMSISIDTGEDIERLKTSMEDGTFDPSKSLVDIIDPPEHPFSSVSIDPDKFAQQVIADKILSQETTKDNRYLKELLKDGDLGVIPGLLRYEKNTAIMSEMLLQRLTAETEDRNYAEIIYDGVDWFALRMLTLGFYEDLTKYSERKGESVLDAVVNMEEEEFVPFMQGVIEEIENEGIISWNNPNALQDRKAFIEKLGFDPHAEELQAMAIADVLLAASGSSFVKGVSRSTFNVLKGITLDVARSKNPISRILQTKGAPQNVVNQAVKSATPTKGVPNSSAQAATHPRTLSGAPTSPGHLPTIQLIQDTNRYVRKWLKGAPKITDDIELSDVLRTRVANVSQLVGRSVLRQEVIPRNFDQFATVIEFGTKKEGKFYAKEHQAMKAAQDLKKQITDAEVSVVKNGEEGFSIRVTKDVLEKDIPRDVSGFTPSSWLGTVASRYFFRGVGSTGGLDDPHLAAMFNQREAGLAKFIKDTEPDLNAARGRVSRDELNVLNEAIKEIWNGPDSTSNKVWWDRTKLDAEVTSRSGKSLTPEGWNYYETYRDLSDFAVYAKASSALKRQVELGYIKLNSAKWNSKFTGRAVNKSASGKIGTLDANEGRILNLAVNPSAKPKDLWLKPKDVKVAYLLDEPFEVNGKAVQYVANPDDVGLLGLDDVFGYNAGPTRTNPRARYFAVSTDGSGFSPRAFLTASSKLEVKKAVEEINKLRSAEKSKTLTDQVVKNNNDWNPDIQTVADWNDFKSRTGLRDSGRILWKARDEPVFAEKSFSEIWSSEDLGTYFGAKQRGDVLTHYGGEPTYNVDPFSALSKDLSVSTNRLAFNAQTLKSKRAFVELLKKELSDLGEGFKLPDGTVTKTAAGDVELSQVHDINRLVDETVITGTTPRHESLKNLQQAIWNRTTKSTFFDEILKKHGNYLMENLYDKTNLKFFQRQITSGDAVTKAMLTWNFHTTLGMFAFDQLFVQGFSAITAAAISPRHGISAVASQPLFQLMLMTGSMEVRKGVAKVLEKLSMSTTAMIPAEVWLEAANYHMKTGRNIVEHTAMELGTGASMRLGPQGMLKNVLDVASFPFRAGERVSRATSAIIAHADFKKTFPDAAFDDSISQRWISNREQNLLLNMNTGNHSTLQRGFAKVPLQWTSYMLRVFEAMASGGRMNLSIAERARLAGFLTVGMGIGSFGVDGAAEGLTEELGFEPGKDVYKFIQSGIVDGLLNLGGINVSLSERLSWIDGVNQFYHNWADAEGLEVVGQAILGPSLTVFTQDALQAINSTAALLNGRPTEFKQDVLTMLRTVKGADNALGALGVLQHGFYKGRTGKIVQIGEIDPMMASMYVLGLKPYEHAEHVRKMDYLTRHKRDVTELQKYYRKKFRTARNFLFEGDDKSYDKIIQEIIAEINTEANISEKERQGLRRLILSVEKDEKQSLVEHWFEHGMYSSIESQRVLEGE